MPATCSRRLSILALTVFVLMKMVSVGHGLPAKAGQGKKTSKHAAAAKPAPKDFEGSFQIFCKEWMEKIRARDTQHVTKWETVEDGVHGKYVEYDPEYTCTLTTGKQPIGKVNYREVWYEKRGKTIAE